MKRLWIYFGYLLLVWGSFRYFVRLPEVIEELWFKPILWLIPLFWWNLSLKENIEMFGKGWGKSILLGLTCGVVYWLIMRKGVIAGLKIDLNILGVAMATAVTEELTFSGFAAGYLERIRKGKWTNLLIVGLMGAIIRLPILLFVYQAASWEVLGVVLIALASGVINAWIRTNSGNVSGSILARLCLNLAALG